MSLMDDIHRAQVHAGEQAVVDNLRKLGLLPDEATFTCVCGHKMSEPSGGAFTVCFGCERQWACIPPRR